MTAPGQSPMSTLRQELELLQQHASSPEATVEAQALAHRDATYLAIDLKDLPVAMEHALLCVRLAQATDNGPLQVKAHVTLALALMEVFDDQGAQREFATAHARAVDCGDARGVALVAVNASHHELERRNYRQAAQYLDDFDTSPYREALQRPDAVSLGQTFHINVVVATAELLMAGDVAWPDVPRNEATLQVSAAEVTRWYREEGAQLPPQDASAALDALTRHALWSGDLNAALVLAHQHVRITQDAALPLLYGRALLDRSRVFACTGDLTGALRDAEHAVQYFERTVAGLWEVRSRETLAATYARAGRYREAFETQLTVTRGVEALYRDYHQQRALVTHIEQHAREAEVRAQALAEAALQDPLTGAPNRTLAMQVLDQLYSSARRGQASAIALLDLDLFKGVNDTYGHLVGDAVLIETTRVLRAALQGQELLARLGGEEFIVIFPDMTVPEAAERCARLRETLHRAPWGTVAPGLIMSGSFGVAALDGQQDITGTLSAADLALYEAKAAGRNRVVVAAAGLA